MNHIALRILLALGMALAGFVQAETVPIGDLRGLKEKAAEDDFVLVKARGMALEDRIIYFCGNQMEEKTRRLYQSLAWIASAPKVENLNTFVRVQTGFFANALRDWSFEVAKNVDERLKETRAVAYHEYTQHILTYLFRNVKFASPEVEREFLFDLRAEVLRIEKEMVGQIDKIQTDFANKKLSNTLPEKFGAMLAFIVAAKVAFLNVGNGFADHLTAWLTAIAAGKFFLWFMRVLPSSTPNKALEPHQLVVEFAQRTHGNLGKVLSDCALELSASPMQN